MNDTCDIFYGNCVYGCVDGFIGDQCDQSIYFGKEIDMKIWTKEIVKTIYMLTLTHDVRVNFMFHSLSLLC